MPDESLPYSGGIGHDFHASNQSVLNGIYVSNHLIGKDMGNLMNFDDRQNRHGM